MGCGPERTKRHTQSLCQKPPERAACDNVTVLAGPLAQGRGRPGRVYAEAGPGYRVATTDLVCRRMQFDR